MLVPRKYWTFSSMFDMEHLSHSVMESCRSEIY